MAEVPDGQTTPAAGLLTGARAPADGSADADDLDIVVTDEPPRPITAARVMLVLGAAVVGVVHYVYADPGSGPRIFADEIGYLANARALAGGHLIDMSNTAFYAGGFSVAIAPLSRIFANDPGRLYTSVIALQAVLAGVSVLLLAAICRWLFSASAPVSIIAACVGALYPTFVTSSGFAWSESMLAFSLLVALSAAAWTMHTLDAFPDRARRLRWCALLTGLACGYVVTVHNRTVLAMIVVVAMLGLTCVLRQRTTLVAWLLGGFVATGGAGWLLNRYLEHKLWHGQGGVDTSGRLSDLFHAHGLHGALLALIGQSWYQVVATGGLAAIAVTAWIWLATRSTPRPTQPRSTWSAQRTFALTLVGVFGGLIAVSSVFLANAPRGDAIVYGRYVEIFTPVMIATAVAWLGTLPAPRALATAAVVVAGAASATFLVLHFRATAELARPFNRVTTLAVLGWINVQHNTLRLFAPTVVAIGLSFAALAVTYVVRQAHARSWVAAGAAALIFVSLFAWALHEERPRVLDALARGATETHATVRAVHDAGVKQLALDHTVTVVDRLALEYWLPNVRFIASTPANATCDNVTSIGHAPTPPAGTTKIGQGGLFYLYRGDRACA